VLHSPQWPLMQACLRATQQMGLVRAGLGAVAIGCVHASLARDAPSAVHGLESGYERI